MPTAAKLVGALLFALLGFVTSELALPLLEGLWVARWTPEINAGIGAFIGWFFAGPRAGGGLVDGMSNGLTATLIGLLAVLITHGVLFSLRASMRGRFRDPVDAIEAAIDFAVQNAQRLATPQQIVVLLLGGICIGLLLELTQSQAA